MTDDLGGPGERDDLTPYVVAALIPITEELRDRLDADLDERDEMAVTTALYKAAQTGVLHGFAAAADRARPHGLDLFAEFSSAADLWRERYGDER